MKRGAQKRPKKATSHSGAIRIISGKWRGRKLPVMNEEGLRPTTDRTKETLFNWLMMHIRDAVCLDAYAGSGSLGLEALSRGASKCVFIERERHIAAQIESNLASLDVSEYSANVLQEDFSSAISKLPSLCESGFSLVFIDPPFRKELVQPTIDQLIKYQMLTASALVYIEVELDHPPLRLPSTWKQRKLKQTNNVKYMLYEIDSAQD